VRARWSRSTGGVAWACQRLLSMQFIACWFVVWTVPHPAAGITHPAYGTTHPTADATHPDLFDRTSANCQDRCWYLDGSIHLLVVQELGPAAVRLWKVSTMLAIATTSLQLTGSTSAQLYSLQANEMQNFSFKHFCIWFYFSIIYPILFSINDLTRRVTFPWLTRTYVHLLRSLLSLLCACCIF